MFAIQIPGDSLHEYALASLTPILIISKSQVILSIAAVPKAEVSSLASPRLAAKPGGLYSKSPTRGVEDPCILGQR